MILARAEDAQENPAGFHLQQSVEKSLKAWLALRGIDYPRTHDLSVLLGLLEDQGEDVESFWPLLELNPFANFEQLARLAQALLARVQSLM